MRRISRTILLLTVAAALLSACSAAGTQSKAVHGQKPVNGKYDPPITLTMIKAVDSNRTFMPGETWDNNLWTQAYRDKIGVQFDYTLTTMPDEYDNKLNMAIASNDLPDYFSCNYDTFYRLATGGKLADLTGLIDTYGSEATKAAYSANDGLLRDQLSIDDKIYGLGAAADLTGAGHMLWYRDDWVKTMGVSAPTNAEDIWKMAATFATGDPNGDGSKVVGFGVSKELWEGGMGLEGWFAMDDACPTIWVQDGNGGLVFGAIDEKCKITLQKLQDAYKSGIIDNDFVNKGAWSEAADDVVKQKIGMVMGPMWFGDWKAKDVMQAMNSKEATWTAMPVPDAKMPFTAKPANVYVVNAKCANPEAAILMGNLTGDLMNGENSEGKYHDQKDPNGETVNNFFHAMGNANNTIIQWNLHCANQVNAALKSGDTSALNDEQRSYYDRCKAFIDWKPGDPADGLSGYASYSTFGPNGSQYVGEKMLNEGLQIMNEFYGPYSATMNENLGNLLSKRDELFTSIIRGDNADALFTEWTNYWHSMMGDKITEEVNAWHKDQQQ